MKLHPTGSFSPPCRALLKPSAFVRSPPFPPTGKLPIRTPSLPPSRTPTTISFLNSDSPRAQLASSPPLFRSIRSRSHPSNEAIDSEPRKSVPSNIKSSWPAPDSLKTPPRIVSRSHRTNDSLFRWRPAGRLPAVRGTRPATSHGDSARPIKGIPAKS